jgi:RNA polymerase sigma-70 factor (ECF subfamily)
MTTEVAVPAGLVRLRSGGRLECVEYGSLTDEQLLARVADERDESAFEELYRRYARAIHAVVRRILREHGASEDAVQEVFASVWRSAAGYRPGRGRAVAWIFTIARNAAVDAARVRRPVVVGDPEEPVDPAAAPHEQTERQLEAFRVHVAVDALPPREREVIALAYYDDLSQSQIAERLGLPLGTVKTRTRSALQRLALDLAGEGVGGVR